MLTTANLNPASRVLLDGGTGWNPPQAQTGANENQKRANAEPKSGSDSLGLLRT